MILVRETFWKACRALDKVLSENIASHSALRLWGKMLSDTSSSDVCRGGLWWALQVQYHPVFGMLHSIFFPFIFLHSKRYIVCIQNSSEENILLKSNLKGVENLIIPFMWLNSNLISKIVVLATLIGHISKSLLYFVNHSLITYATETWTNTFDLISTLLLYYPSFQHSIIWN